MEPDDYRCFIPDLYKTGWKSHQHSYDEKLDRTTAKIEARRLAAETLGLGSSIRRILQRHEVVPIVTRLLTVKNDRYPFGHAVTPFE